MKTRSQKTLKEYGLNEETFTALWEAQNGCCAICGIPEAELEQKYSRGGAGFLNSQTALVM
jgi:hypothetical protein